MRVNVLLAPWKYDFDSNLSASIELPDNVGDLILREDLILKSWQLFQL